MGQSRRLTNDAALYEQAGLELDPDTCAPVGATAGTTQLPNLPEGFGPVPGGGFDAYAELRTADGTVAACSLPVSEVGRPDLPEDVTLTRGEQRYFDVGSAEGSG